MTVRTFNRVLIVEDDESLRAGLARALGERFETVDVAGSVAAAIESVAAEIPDLLLLDFELPDGSALDVLKALAPLERAPLVVAMSGSAEPNQSFELAQLGVRAYLPKPLDLTSLEATLEEVASTPPDLRPQVRASVGQRPIHEVEEEVRSTMLNEAMSQAKGSRRGAARLLEVSRQLVQHMLRRQDD